MEYDGATRIAPMMNAGELAAALGKPRSWIYAAVRDGRLPAFRVGQALRFDSGEIATWLLARRAGPEPVDENRSDESER